MKTRFIILFFLSFLYLPIWLIPSVNTSEKPTSNNYNRNQAIRYADRWWNDRNNGDVDDRHSIVNCDYLHNYLDYLVSYGNVVYKTQEYIDGTEMAPSNMEAGDVIIFGHPNDHWEHAVIVDGGNEI